MVAANERTAFGFSLSAGQAGDAPEGRKLLEAWLEKKPKGLKAVIMDWAYGGDETRQLVMDLGLEPVVPPKANRLNPWEYDRELYKKRNEARAALPALEILPAHLFTL